MTPLTDLQVLALLVAAPVDEDATADLREIGPVKPGHVSKWERDYARQRLSTGRLGPDYAREARQALARVFGLPERDGSEPIVMELAWESDKAVPIPASNVARMMDALSSCGLGAGLMRDVEALCAEVLELRAKANT